VKSTILVDYRQATGRIGYLVRALLRFEGSPRTSDSHVPLNLSLVLDRSGSMSGSKLEYARDAAALLVRRLRPDDIVSVVTYDDQVDTLAEPNVSQGEAELARAIGRIHSGGSTNLSGGWLRGRELVSRNLNASPSEMPAVNRVLLMTDGLANVGITDSNALAGLCANAFENGVSTSTIGFGSDYDEELLRSMADRGGGHSYYIENPDQAPGVFEEEIEGLLGLAAQNIELRIVPEQFVELVNVYNDYPSHGGAGGITVTLGDLYAREPKSLLVEFFAPGGGSTAAKNIAEIVVTADVLDGDNALEHQRIRIPVAATLEGSVRQEPEIERVQVLLDAAKAREEARKRGRVGDVGGAAHVLREASARCVSCPSQDETMREQAEDLAEMASRYESGLNSAADEKYLYQRAYNTWREKKMYDKKISRRRPSA
jgi:Ca-activated chloride channel family protein